MNPAAPEVVESDIKKPENDKASGPCSTPAKNIQNFCQDTK